MTGPEEGSLKFKLLYFFMYGGLGVLAPYVPVFFERLQMSGSQIGFLLMIPSVSSFIFAPPWSILCDRLNLRSEVMFFALVTSQIMTFAMYFFDAFLSMSLIVMIGSIVKAPLTSLLDSLVIESLVDKTRYGSLRLWGAVSFALTSFLGGAIIAAFGGDTANDVHPFLYVFGLHALFGGLTGVIIFSILLRSRHDKTSRVRLEKLRSEQKDFCDVGDDLEKDQEGIPFEEEVAVTGNKSQGASLISVLTSDASVGIFLVVVFCSGLGSGVIDGFLFLRLKKLGGTGLVMGVSRAITCIAEVPCFHVSGMLQKKLGTWRLLALTQAAFVIRFAYYSLLTEPWAVLPCEVLHGFTFAIMWSTACTYADEIAPTHIHSTIQVTVRLHGLTAHLSLIVTTSIFPSRNQGLLFI
jgi:MFS_1 like family